MNVKITVTGERLKASNYGVNRTETEEYTSAEVDVTGTAHFVSDTLRALADSIYKPGLGEVVGGAR